MPDQKISELDAYAGSDGAGTLAYALAGANYKLTPPQILTLAGNTALFTTALDTKLSGIATGATANSSDATLLDRANHTGSQAISTVTGLQTALDGKLALTGGTLTGGLTVGGALDVNGSFSFTPGASVTPVDDGDMTLDFPTAYTFRINGKHGGSVRSLTMPFGYDFCTFEQFGAVGDGSTDDTSACQAAMATGKTIHCRSGANYKISGSLTFAGDGQLIVGNGCAFTAAAASFNAFTLPSGIDRAGIRDIVYEGAAQTGGRVIHITGANRSSFKGLRVHNPYDFLYASETNLVHLSDAWINNVRGDYGITWFGNSTKRSDVFELVGVTISSTAGDADGIRWRGDCHTMTGHSVRVVGCRYGLRIFAEDGTTPALGIFHDFEADFCTLDNISIEAGEDFYFTNIYSHGAGGDNLNIGAAVTAGRVIVQGGKITSAGAWGISNAVEVLCQNVIFSGNTSGNISGNSKVSYDSTFYNAIVSGDPYLNFDVSDYIQFDRSANQMIFVIGGVTVMRLSNASNSLEARIGGTLTTVT